MKKLIEIKQTSGGFEYELSPQGKRCQFLQFLINTSDFSWRKPTTEQTMFDYQKRAFHLVSKLCAIGYLFQPIKSRKVVRAVFAMDANKYNSFGNGKSLFSRVVGEGLSTIMIDGRNKRAIEGDNFLWRQVTESTKLVILDNWNEKNEFSRLFHEISGDWTVNEIGVHTYEIPFSISPRILINGMRPVPDTSLSYTDRLWYVAFSDYYRHCGNSEFDGNTHTPYDDFGNMFIEGWDTEQRELLNQLFIECQQIYLEFGVQSANVAHLINQ